MTDSNEEPKHVIYIKAESLQSNLQEDMSLSNETAPTSMNTSIKKEVQEATCQSDPKNLSITWKIYKDFKICIYKPLIPLKLALFFWYGDGAVITPFLTVYFKQRGLALSELSIIYMIAPVVQFIGTTLSGVIADKIGRSKPVLIGKGIGSLIGGLIMDAYGGRTAFRVIAIICLVAAVLYGFYVYIRLSYCRTKHYFSKKDVNGSAGCKKVTKELYTPRSGS